MAHVTYRLLLDPAVFGDVFWDGVTRVHIYLIVLIQLFWDVSVGACDWRWVIVT